MKTAVNENVQVYYSGTYWNDFPRVLQYMSECFTGDPNKSWVTDFQERYCQKPFEHALVLNCGNGWVEREFVDRELTQRVTAFDYSEELLRQAGAERKGRPISYFRADANHVGFQPASFDLIVNVAALHHVQYIDSLSRVLTAALRIDGIFVNFDYIGPARNQYSLGHWLRVRRANRTLPSSLRKSRLRRPHLPTMLVTDPTEAIHSDLIFETMARYFDVFERHDTGGGIAYELLTHNPKLRAVPPDELNPQLDRLLELDARCTRSGRVPPLFSYFLARPKAAPVADHIQLERWRQDEVRRESRAAQRGGAYTDLQYVELKAHRLGASLRKVMRTAWDRLRRQSGHPSL